MTKSDYISKCIEKRIEMGYTKAEVARGFGIARSAITRFEQGKYNSLDLFIYYMNLERRKNA